MRLLGYYAVLPGLVVEEALPTPPGAVEQTAGLPQDHSIFDLMFGSGPVVQAVLLLLLVMSVITWGIVAAKMRQMHRARKQTQFFSNIFWESRNLAQIDQSAGQLLFSPVARLFSAGYAELTQMLEGREKKSSHIDPNDIENIERAMRRAKTEELTRLEKGTTFLATTASAAPFIGLFGTVWGIMTAFIGLSKVKSSSIQAVAPGISEALIATAIGLAAAIPAAIFYNLFMQQVRVLSRKMDVFSAEFLNIARRYFVR